MPQPSSSLHRMRPVVQACLLLALGASATGAALAQTLPDAGGTLRDIQRTPAAPQTVAPPAIQGPAGAGARSTDTTPISVRAIRFTGSDSIDTQSIQPIAASLVGRTVTLGDLQDTANRITAQLRAQGYAVALATLPAQDATEGTITFQILEGRLEQLDIRNESRVKTERVQAMLSRIEPGRPVRQDDLEQALGVLNELPGVGRAGAVLQPGNAAGGTRVAVELGPQEATQASVALDNHGNRYTGEWRASADVQLNSPAGLGDQANLTLMRSNGGLNYGRAAYALPVLGDGTRLGASATLLNYRLGKEFAALQAHGQLRSLQAQISRPLTRSTEEQTSVNIGFEHRIMDDRVDSVGTQTEKTINAVSVTGAGQWQSSEPDATRYQAQVSLVIGKLDIRTPAALAADAASARTDGAYARMAFSAQAIKPMGTQDQLVVRTSGQIASTNLDSSEKFSLGGPNAVRAYPVGEAAGDEGLLLTVEWRRAFSEQLQGSIFHDLGMVRVNHAPFIVGAANSRTLGGLGLGLNWRSGGTELRGAIAWRTTGGDPTSVPPGAHQHRSPTLWVQASHAF